MLAHLQSSKERKICVCFIESVPERGKCGFSLLHELVMRSEMGGCLQRSPHITKCWNHHFAIRSHTMKGWHRKQLARCAHESCLWKYSTLWSKYWAFKNVITKGLKIFIFFKCIKPVWEGGWMSYWKHLLCTFNWTMERTRQKGTLISQTEIKAQILRAAPGSSQKLWTVNLALTPPFILVHGMQMTVRFKGVFFLKKKCPVKIKNRPTFDSHLEHRTLLFF